jgi:hypothetical protein
VAKERSSCYEIVTAVFGLNDLSGFFISGFRGASRGGESLIKAFPNFCQARFAGD